jgi:hypothetical protein
VLGAANDVLALRFSSVHLPQGVNISSAYLEFTPTNRPAFAQPLELIVAIQSTPVNDVTFASFDISNRMFAASEVRWNISSWGSAASETSASLTSLFQLLLSLPSWRMGNDVLLTIRPANASRFGTATRYGACVASSLPHGVLDHVLTSTIFEHRALLYRTWVHHPLEAAAIPSGCASTLGTVRMCRRLAAITLLWDIAVSYL